MNPRQPRAATPRGGVAPIHRGPQATTQGHAPQFQHAPNAALLIDFDNVTMGIRSDLASELRNLLSSDIIKGKVAVQRAYADWRRYPQYIVPLAESSIDMIMAPAYGSSKKNATDIRLSVDAIELVFTRPEIGTYILLSGDSDFASLVTKLKEYGKYVIGVGIRESSSDLLVMNCDEYYSYNALAGLVKSGEEESVKWDPWELVVEAINRMVKNGDVMRSDRLKQVMQDIDPTFDEKNLGMSKFSKFCQEAAQQGLIRVIKLENGQLEVAPANGTARPVAPPATAARPSAPATRPSAPAARPSAPAARAGAPAPHANANGEREERGRRGRRGGRGRGRDRELRETREQPAAPVAPPVAPPVEPVAPPVLAASPEVAAAPESDGIGRGGERLTREEAFDLVRRATASLVSGDTAVSARAVRERAFALLGRDSESLAERLFTRVLRDAHDAEVIDLRRRGDDYEVSLPAEVAPVAEQLNRAAAARASAQTPSPATTTPRGIGLRGIVGRGRAGARPTAPPPDLLSIGVVDEVPAIEGEPPAAAQPAAEAPAAKAPGTKSRAKKGTRGRATKKAAAPRNAGAKDGNTEAAAKTPRKSRGRGRKPANEPVS